MIAVQPESAAFADTAGSLLRQRGHRKMRPNGSSPRCETRPQVAFEHCTMAVMMIFPSTSLSPVSPNSGYVGNWHCSSLLVRQNHLKNLFVVEQLGDDTQTSAELHPMPRSCTSDRLIGV